MYINNYVITAVGSKSECRNYQKVKKRKKILTTDLTRQDITIYTALRGDRTDSNFGHKRKDNVLNRDCLHISLKKYSKYIEKTCE